MTRRHERIHLAFVLVILPSVTGWAQSSRPVVLVAASGGRDVHVHDATSLSRLASVRVGGGPHEIAVSADGRRAFVADAGSPREPGATITVIDVATRKAERTIPLPAGCKPHDLRVSRDGTRIWSTCAPAPRVVEIDAASGRVTGTWDTGRDGGWMLIVTPDERKIYVANLEGRSLSVVERSTGVVRTIALDGGAMGMDLSPDGRELWVGGFDADRIWVIDAGTDRIAATIDNAFKAPGRIRFVPGTRRVLVQHSGNKLSVLDAGTRREEAALDLGDGAKCLAVTPDGRRAYVGHPAANAVSVVDLQALKVVERFDAGPAPDGVAWSAPR